MATVLCGVSIPRSGHHYMQTLLAAALGEGLFYCEHYTPADCCSQVPCTRGDGSRLVFTKNHDFALSLPTDLGGTLGLIQYRAPVSEALSDLEMVASVWGDELAADRYFIDGWLARKAAFILGFHERWIEPRPNNCFLLPYERLLMEPDAVLEQVLTFCGLDLSRQEAAAAASTVAGTRAQPVHSADAQSRRDEAFKPRRVDPDALPHADSFARFESMLADRLPSIAQARHLETPKAADGVIEHLFEAARAGFKNDPEGASKHCEAAAKAEPDHPYPHLTLGKALMRAGKWPEAADAFRNARQRMTCGDPDLWMDLTRALWEIGAGEEAAKEGAVLVGPSPHDGHCRALHAMALLQAGDIAAAHEEARQALALGVNEPFLRGQAQRVLSETSG